MKKLAIIPARGGSKRIPRKNVKDFLGKPIIAYSIEAAIDSGLFDEIMVSTDDSEIAEIAKSYGATLPFMRSEVNANDQATTFDVIKEVIDKYEEIGKNFDKACCLYPTAPFVNASILKNFSIFLNQTNFDCVFPVLQYSYPIQRALKLSEEGHVAMINKEYLNTRSQDLEARYHDAGQFYFFRVKPLLAAEALWTNNTGVRQIEEMSAQDIDNDEDWKIAEFKYKFFIK